ncbi:very short patch repair endonuclease [Desulfobacterota bacterium M19]
MTDKINCYSRSKNMAAIKNKDTKPEIIVRKFLHKSGYRFRLHRKDLPGKPDITLARFKTVIFVHGCFWHRHEQCDNSVMPKSNVSFWRKKLNGNVVRDKKNIKLLKELGWKVLVVWECEVKNDVALHNLVKQIR